MSEVRVTTQREVLVYEGANFTTIDDRLYVGYESPPDVSPSAVFADGYWEQVERIDV